MIDRHLLPILRPLLPPAERIHPYLERIDRSRFYSNFGPLCRELEDRISAGRGVGVVTFTSGTTALELALQEIALPGATHCICPSWTFIATPCAARHIGLNPYFVDVDRKSWALTPEGVKAALRSSPGAVGAVIVVAPFGSPVDPKPWERFQEETGIPVIIDAAAGFDGFPVSDIPVMVSLHATKTLGVGEGGFIASTNIPLVEALRSRSVFGFSDSREAVRPGTNAKISEYTAAVGLAGLDAWEQTKQGYRRVRETYLKALEALPEVDVAPGLASGMFETSTFNVILPGGRADDTLQSLAASGISGRFWWGKGCHRHRAYAQCPREPLPVTEELGERVLGLPFYLDLGEGDIQSVVVALGEALRAGEVNAPRASHRVHS